MQSSFSAKFVFLFRFLFPKVSARIQPSNLFPPSPFCLERKVGGGEREELKKVKFLQIQESERRSRPNLGAPEPNFIVENDNSSDCQASALIKHGPRGGEEWPFLASGTQCFRRDLLSFYGLTRLSESPS